LRRELHSILSGFVKYFYCFWLQNSAKEVWMTKQWLEITLQVPAEAIDLACHLMAELGSEGVTVEERPLDTFIPPDPDEVKAGDYLLKVYFPPTADSESLRRDIRDRLVWLADITPGLVPVLPEVRPVRQEDWAEGWKQHFSAVRIGTRLVVKPSWESFPAKEGDAVVTLDPGMAFGTGTHGTTRLCLEALARRFEQAPPPESVLDVGTGSGILAIAAVALGAARVLACDIDPTACLTARENARLNGIGQELEVTDRPLADLEGTFQVVLANILAEENIRLAPQLIDKLAAGGSLILSGILQEKEDLVIDAFRTFKLVDPDVCRQEEWSCLIYRKEA
jgi:ribosomal protein L11 methyltransferase